MFTFFLTTGIIFAVPYLLAKILIEFCTTPSPVKIQSNLRKKQIQPVVVVKKRSSFLYKFV